MTETATPAKRKKRTMAQVMVQRINRMKTNVDRLRRMADKALARHDKALKQLQAVQQAAAIPQDVPLEDLPSPADLVAGPQEALP